MLALAALVLVGYVTVLVAAPIHAWSGTKRVADVPTGDRPSGADGHTYLLVGSDSREGMTKEQEDQLRTGYTSGKRTDSILLVHIPSGGGKSVLISVPRDSYVPIPGHGSNKVNAAFAFGGAALLIETLEQATGLPIDGYLEIGFSGFASLVTALGGVNICIQEGIHDAKSGVYVDAGCQTLDAPTALGFVRARYFDPRGDIGRADRQRQFLSALLKQLVTPSTVLWAPKWWATTHAAVSGLEVGEDTSVFDAGRIALALRGVSRGETLSLVVPLKTTNGWANGMSIVRWDKERALALFAMLKDGTAIETPPAGTDGKPSDG